MPTLLFKPLTLNIAMSPAGGGQGVDLNKVLLFLYLKYTQSIFMFIIFSLL
jgi:hypothetical protein